MMETPKGQHRELWGWDAPGMKACSAGVTELFIKNPKTKQINPKTP